MFRRMGSGYAGRGIAWRAYWRIKDKKREIDSMFQYTDLLKKQFSAQDRAAAP